MDATFHGGSNDIIGGRGLLRRPWPTSAAVADFGGQRYRRFIPFNFLLYLAAPHLHGVLVLVTDIKFIAGVVVNADNWSPVSTMNLSPVSMTPAITENP
jgi:hypothetical protein